MKVKGTVVAVLGLIAVGLLWILLDRGPDVDVPPGSKPAAAPTPVAQSLPPAALPAVEKSERPAIPDPDLELPAEPVAPELFQAPVMEQANQLHQPGTSVDDDLDILDTLLEYSRKTFKTMPSAGLNEEFVAHLVGNNDKGVQMFPADHPSINDKGELEDRWGTPYFFHPMSDRLVEITSAGPDRILFTEDDVTRD